eukprot:TRINITY_DN12_c0_g1_i2.p1 TRINITY_DN12_c0_g1~~TRINITY_DN12_c0_g1_i2.p1  ORF type:complete len:298 (+),score=54.42 TRINITY_DN12_c0_g1_i2:309-1202(+)
MEDVEETQGSDTPEKHKDKDLKKKEKERKKQLALEKKQTRTYGSSSVPLIAQERFAKSDSALPLKEQKEDGLALRNALSAGGGMKELAGQRDTLGDEFSSVLNNPVSREYFRRFLIRNATEEHLRFLFEIRKYNSQKDPEERFDTLYTIVNKFVKLDLKDTVNLSSAVRSDILSKWEEIENGNLDLLGDELLAEAYYYVFILLRDDSYTKFTNSSECAEMKKLDSEGNPPTKPICHSAPSKLKPESPQPVLVSSAPPQLSNSKSSGSLDSISKDGQKSENQEKKKRGFWPFRKDAKS